MSVIPVEVQMSSEQLLKAIEQMSEPDLEEFVTQVLLLKARRRNANLSTQESEWLLQINQAIPPELQARFNELVAKRQAFTLTDAEHAELLQLTDQIEQRDAERIEALGKLAQLRGRSLPEIMKDLGIQLPDCV
jgi:hypothetical protein